MRRKIGAERARGIPPSPSRSISSGPKYITLVTVPQANT